MTGRTADTAPAPDESLSAAARMRWAIVDCWSLVWRQLLYYRQQPTIILWQLGFPIVSVLLFVYVFGSAMEIGSGADYKSFAMPGMFAMTMAFGFMNTAYAMVIDKEKGVTDRFRSMPIARSAVVTGRGVGDVLGAAIDLAVLAAIALVVGWRSDGSLAATLLAFVLLLWLRFALIWIGVYLGMLVPTQEQAGNLFAVAFPFGMISSVLTPPDLMPGWLGAIAAWNPVSSTAAAIRRLFESPAVASGYWIEEHPIAAAVVWPAVITGIFLFLAVRQYLRLGR
jgi:ABC-type polysaccharide/polyol phosphate export permease